jgi:hypothetical protein
MKRQWIFAGIILAGAGLLVAWIARSTYWDTVRVPVPLKGEAAINPFYSRMHLASALGARVEKRDMLGDLPPPTAIITLSHWHWDVIESRRRQLEQWVEAGGRLIVDNTLSGGEAFSQWSGISQQHAHATGDTEEESQEDESQDTPDSFQTLFGTSDGLCKVLTVAPATNARREYHVCNIAEDSWLTHTRAAVWTLEQHDAAQAVRMNIGRGSVTMLNATPFGNRELLEVDHAVLFVALTQLKRGELIVFVSEETRPTLLALIWTHGKPAIVLAGLLLLAALWRGGVRFGPLAAIPDRARRSIAEQIRGTGQFTLRFGGGRALHAAVVRALEETARRSIPGYASMSPADRIEAIARTVDVDAEQLAETIHYTGARRAGELRNAVLALEHVRRRLRTRQLKR